MFHILGFLFIIILAVLIIGLSIIGSVVRGIFRLGNGARRTSDTTTNNNHTAQPEEPEIRPKRKKIFAEDEGEYVEFEEIKE